MVCTPVLQAGAQSVSINTDGSTAWQRHAGCKEQQQGNAHSRLTLAERNAVASPATGLMIYQTDNTPGFYFYDGTTWVSIISASNNLWTRNGNHIYNSNTNNVGIGIQQCTLAKTSCSRQCCIVFSGPAMYRVFPVIRPYPAGQADDGYPDKAAFRSGYAKLQHNGMRRILVCILLQTGSSAVASGCIPLRWERQPGNRHRLCCHGFRSQVYG